MSKSKARLLTIVSVLVVAGAFAAILVGRNVAVGASPSPPREDLERVSNAGTDVGPSARMQAVLERTGTAGGVVRNQGHRADKAFYRLTGTPRGTCYGIGFKTGAETDLNQIECGSTFPSTDQPILDASVIEEDQTGAVRVVEVQGWAADGVASVAVLDASDRVVAEARVSRNIYAIDAEALRSGDGVKLIARDRNGSVVYTQQYN